jgi:hypothetical protein
MHISAIRLLLLSAIGCGFVPSLLADEPARPTLHVPACDDFEVNG